MAAYARRHNRAIEHAARNDARCSDAAGAGQWAVAHPHCQQHRVPHLSQHRGIPLGVYDRSDWLVVVRTLIVIWLASRFRRGPKTDFAEPISVVIAAYNEEKVIAQTLRTLLATEYNGEIEVIVVDDGSRDQTSAEVERIAASEPRVRLFQQENRGKAHALQRGLAGAHNGVIVFIDADTQCQRDTLPRLLEPFADKRIGAVSGHAKVGNLRTFVARCQALEYTCGFNLDRRAYNRWNCITVVPGAISALRKDAIDAAGGLSLETLAEDTDLTLSLHRHRQRIMYVPDAIAWTSRKVVG